MHVIVGQIVTKQEKVCSCTYHVASPLTQNIETETHVPVKLKLQHPPPPGIPRAFDCDSCPGRREFERCLERVGNLNQIYLLF